MYRYLIIIIFKMFLDLKSFKIESHYLEIACFVLNFNHLLHDIAQKLIYANALDSTSAS